MPKSKSVLNEIFEAKAFVLDQKDSRNSIYVELEDGQVLNTGYVGKISYDTYETPEIVITKSKTTRQGIANITIYDKQTFLFEPDRSLVSKMKNIFLNSDITNLMVARKGKNTSLLTLPKQFITSTQMTDEVSPAGERTLDKKKSEKEDYKAYETPSVLLEKLIEIIDKRLYESTAKNHIASKLRSIIGQSNYATKANEIVGSSGMAQIVDYASTYILSQALGSSIYAKKIMIWAEAEGTRDFRAFTHLIDGAKKDEKIIAIVSFFEKLTKEGPEKGYMSNATFPKNAQEWKRITGKTINPAAIPIFDPHAGSGKGMLDAFDNKRFNGQLQGIEIRELEYDDERCRIISGTNISSHYTALTSTFNNGLLKTNAQNLISYHNPPYTSDDSIAKETIQAYPDKMMITGLFPTKLKAFLSNNLSANSILVKVPRELTGYTDPKTPEEFLFVIGEKLNREDVYMDFNKSMVRKAGINAPMFKSASSMTELDEVMEMHFANNKAFSNKIGNSYEYYIATERRDALISKLENEVEAGEMIYRNREKIAQLLMNKTKDLLNQMSPIEVAKRQKVFPDNRFYKADSSTDMLSFSEVLSNIPLLIHYRDKNPEMFSLVESVAASLNTSIPIDKKAQEAFIFGQKPQEEKERVTSKSLGMMKLYYNPSMISLKEEDSKNTLMDIIMSCYNYNIEDENKERLEVAIGMAHTLVTKSEITVDHTSGQIMPTDIFVLADEFGGDIGKLDIDIDDIYEKMEEKGLFNIDDYIELAEISPNKQEIIMENFLKDMEHTVAILADSAGINRDDMMEDLINTGMSLYTKARNKELGSKEKFTTIFNFIDKYKLEMTFKDLYRDDINRYEKDVARILESTYLGMLTKDHIVKISKFIRDELEENPLRFYEDTMQSVADTVHEKIGEHYLQDDRTTLIDCKSKFADELSDLTTPLYQSRKSMAISYSRMGDMLLSYYVPMRYHMKGTDTEPGMQRTDENISSLYTSFFRRMFIKSLGLQKHQYEEAERFLEISDETKMKQLFIEARGGKTRTFIAMGYFLSLFNQKQMNIILETSNMTDISNQMAESFPHLALRGNYFVGDKGKVNKNPDHIFSSLPTLETYPLPFRSLPQTRFVGSGAAVTELVEGFGKRYDITRDALDAKYGNLKGEELINMLKDKYKDSRLVRILTACG